MRLTKRFMDWYQGNNDKEKETPAGGIKRVGYVLWNYVGRLVVVNMLFLLCCIPIVTIPAALAALNRYLLGIYRVGYGFSLEDYWKEFKSGILKNLPAGLLTGGLGFYAYYLMSLAGNFDRGTIHDVLIGCGMGVMIFAILIGAYYFVMSAMLDLGAGALLKNTLILMTVEWKLLAAFSWLWHHIPCFCCLPLVFPFHRCLFMPVSIGLLREESCSPLRGRMVE